ncbi:hypothetical protein AXF42_Ash020288 [Apostasia shenzhenica]|uniref:Uncharacterized protein n=1 Tax=Apostasia shenzhenica TaxID=1088818 RepID=A0A2H9ZSX9_9ASPA|nr:hypothetical protein AXF42_Ash020288 [Apostasia shenzhenica]
MGIFLYNYSSLPVDAQDTSGCILSCFIAPIVALLMNPTSPQRFLLRWHNCSRFCWRALQAQLGLARTGQRSVRTGLRVGQQAGRDRRCRAKPCTHVAVAGTGVNAGASSVMWKSDDVITSNRRTRSENANEQAG